MNLRQRLYLVEVLSQATLDGRGLKDPATMKPASTFLRPPSMVAASRTPLQ